MQQYYEKNKLEIGLDEAGRGSLGALYLRLVLS